MSRDDEKDDFRQGVQLALTMAMTLAHREPGLSGAELALALRETLEETVFEKGAADLMWRPIHFRDAEQSGWSPPYASGGFIPGGGAVTFPATPLPPSSPRSNSAKDIADWLEAWFAPSAPGGAEKRLTMNIYRELSAGRGINAIKEYRAGMGTSLKESKEGVLEFKDRMIRAGRLPSFPGAVSRGGLT